MKLSSFLLVITFLQTLAVDSYSQITKLNLDFNNVTVENALKTIEDQSEFFFLYSPKIVDVSRKLNLRFTDEKIDIILSRMFSGSDVDYIVKDRQIVLSDKEMIKKFIEPLKQQVIVRGTVTDVDGNPLPGVTVTVKGTTRGTVTDTDGKYELENVPEDAVLVFSFVGMLTQEIEVGTQTIIDVIMEIDRIGIEEVVVIGYGTQKKINLTGAVSQVESSVLENRSVTNVSSALQGVSAGLTVTSNSNLGGEPGAPLEINIRGLGSLSGGEPYVLVDGVPMDINNINPNDIENISVLKDAASSAIYGSRAPFGVILITTKSGKKSGKPTLSYSGNVGWAAPTVLPELSNSLDFANALNEAALNTGQSPLFTEVVIERIINRMNDPDYPSNFPDPSNPEVWANYMNSNDNIEYYDVYYQDWSLQQSHNFSINGGSQNSSYYFGLGYVFDEGQLNYITDKYERYNILAKMSSDVTDWMTVRLNSKFAYYFNNYPTSTYGSRDLIYRQIARAWPTEPVYLPNGDINIRDLTQIPFLMNGGSDKSHHWDVWLTPSLEIKLSEYWNINADYSYNLNFYTSNYNRNRITSTKVDGVTEDVHYAQTWNGIFQTLSNKRYMTSNIYTKYARGIENHFFEILIGGQAELNNYMSLYGEKRDLVTEAVPSISTATGEYNVDDNISHWSTMGAFARLTYNYKEKYLFEFNSRYDGSSRFGEGNRWGFFPSFSVGYNISKENFWESLSNYVNNMKIRASYGTLGNQHVANYLQIPILPIRTKLPYIINDERPIYTGIPNLESINLTWETSKTINIGLDASFINNRLDFTFDWYTRTTENMFGPGETLPAVFGASVPQKNNATLETKGFDLSVGWKQKLNDFNYQVRLNLSDNKSKVVQYNNPTKLISNYYEGMVLGEIWGYETIGFFESDEDVQDSPSQSMIYSTWTPGDIKYKDLNGDGEITWGDRTVDNPGDMKIIGNGMPRYIFGIDMRLEYKGLDLAMLFQGVGKRDYWMPSQNINPMFGFGNSFYVHSLMTVHLDYWSPDNTDAYLPKPYMNKQNQKNWQAQTRYLQDFSYLRLKNLQIGYTLPSKITNRVNIEKIRLYFTGENILTFSNVWGPFDPETALLSGYNLYPLRKTFSFGLNMTF